MITTQTSKEVYEKNIINDDLTRCLELADYNGCKFSLNCDLLHDENFKFNVPIDTVKGFLSKLIENNTEEITVLNTRAIKEANNFFRAATEDELEALSC